MARTKVQYIMSTKLCLSEVWWPIKNIYNQSQSSFGYTCHYLNDNIVQEFHWQQNCWFKLIILGHLKNIFLLSTLRFKQSFYFIVQIFKHWNPLRWNKYQTFMDILLFSCFHILQGTQKSKRNALNSFTDMLYDQILEIICGL